MEKQGTASVVQGWYMEFVGAVVCQLPRDIDSVTADGWVKSQEALKKVLRGTLLPDGKLKEGNVYPVAVDYGKSVEEMVKLGRYDWHNDDIASEHFPTERSDKEEVVIELVHFDRDISTDKALEELEQTGYRPAELRELLAFGVKYPKIQREFPIIALGSVWQSSDGNRDIPCLRRHGSERRLDLHWIEHGWAWYLSFCRGPQVALWPWDFRTSGPFGPS